MKRITILKRQVLSRGTGGWFNQKSENIILIDNTDLKIKKELEQANKSKRSRLFKVEYDFNLKTKKGYNEFISFLLENEKEYSYYFDTIYDDLDDLKNEIMKASE